MKLSLIILALTAMRLVTAGRELSGEKWVIKKDKGCVIEKNAEEYRTLADAQDACLQLGRGLCRAVHDSKCNGEERGTFYTCNLGSFINTKTKSCVHKSPVKLTSKAISDLYGIETKKACTKKHSQTFSNPVAAQYTCLLLGASKCSGVFDKHCDGDGAYSLCKPGALASSLEGSCVQTLAAGTTKPPTTTTAATTSTSTAATPDGWSKQSVTNCNRLEEFSSLERAQAACLQLGDEECSGVLHEGCSGTRAFTCRPDSFFTEPRSTNCIYTPPAETSTTTTASTTTAATPDGWSKQSATNCNRLEEFPSLERAQAACLQLGDEECSGVFHEGCSGTRAFTCGPNSFVTDSRNTNCIYTPSAETLATTDGWSKQSELTYCTRLSAAYSSLERAKNECLQLGVEECSGIRIDDGCNGNKYYTCRATTFSTDRSRNSCIFVPPTDTTTTTQTTAAATKQDLKQSVIFT